MSRNRENSKILWIRKVSRNRENSKILWIRKVSRNGKTAKSLVMEKISLTRGTERPFRCLDLDISNNPILNSISSIMVQLMPTAMMVTIISVMMRDDHQVWVLLSPPFEAQIIQSLAAKKATFMPRHSGTVPHSAAPKRPLLRQGDFYGMWQPLCLIKLLQHC